MLPNSKFEYRNPKQIRMTEIRNRFRTLENSDFEFVSNFGFRASDFRKNHLEITIRNHLLKR